MKINSDISSLLPPEITALFHDLLPYKNLVAEVWLSSYKSIFNNKGQNVQRISKVYRALTSQLISDLSQSNASHFARTLQRCSRLFYNMGVPFEEVMLSIHLFQEACLTVIINNLMPDADDLIGLRLAFDQIGTAGLQMVSAHYFDVYRTQAKYEISAAQDENIRIKSELDILRSRYELNTKENIQGIHTTMSEISKKLRQDALLQRTVYRLTLALDRAKNEDEVIAVAITFFKSILPEKTEILVVVRQEEIKERLLVYKESTQHKIVEFCDEILTEDLSPLLKSALLSTDGKPIVSKQDNQMAQAIFQSSALDFLDELILLPLVRFREAIGLIWIAYPGKGLLTGKSPRHLKRFIRIIAAALSSVRYFDYYKVKRKAYIAISRHGAILSTSKNLHHLIDSYLSALLEMTGAERVSIMIPDSARGYLMTVAAKGFNVYPFSGIQFAPGEGIAGTAYKEKKTLCISHLRSNSIRKESPVKSLACIPILSNDICLGVINLSSIRRVMRFDPPIVEAASSLADKMSDLILKLENKQ